MSFIRVSVCRPVPRQTMIRAMHTYQTRAVEGAIVSLRWVVLAGAVDGDPRCNGQSERAQIKARPGNIHPSS